MEPVWESLNADANAATDSTMSEEIFGPLLPIIRADYRKACQLTQNGEHPLGVYIFSNDPKEIEYSMFGRNLCPLLSPTFTLLPPH